MEPITLQFLGASGTVTGSKYLLEQGERRALIDAGMYQGEKPLRKLNWAEFPVDPSTIDFVILTHAHADHTAYLPALVNQGFSGDVYCTEASARLAEIVLRDAAHLQELATKDAVKGGYSKHKNPRPLYTSEDAERAIRQLRWVNFDENIDLDGWLWARWTRAGHILGSASVRVDVGDTSVLFSGDLGRENHKLLKSREIPEGAQWVLCESTYGDREHAEPDVPHANMVETINRTIDRGGAVLIPAFAIDRTQAIMYEIAQMQRDGRIPLVPVIVDGPMSMRALDVYRDMPEEFRDDVNVADFAGVQNFIEARGGREHRKVLKRKEPRIIISSSGMLEGGRVLAHLQQLLRDPKNAVILTGFQANGTRGRDLIDGRQHIKIKGQYVPVRAEVTQDREFSGHADQSELLDWVRALEPKPEMIYLIHGEPHASEALEERIETDLGIPTVIPKLNEKVLLSDVPFAEFEEELFDEEDVD